MRLPKFAKDEKVEVDDNDVSDYDSEADDKGN